MASRSWCRGLVSIQDPSVGLDRRVGVHGRAASMAGEARGYLLLRADESGFPNEKVGIFLKPSATLRSGGEQHAVCWAETLRGGSLLSRIHRRVGARAFGCLLQQCRLGPAGLITPFSSVSGRPAEVPASKCTRRRACSCPDVGWSAYLAHLRDGRPQGWRKDSEM